MSAKCLRWLTHLYPSHVLVCYVWFSTSIFGIFHKWTSGSWNKEEVRSLVERKDEKNNRGKHLSSDEIIVSSRFSVRCAVWFYVNRLVNLIRRHQRTDDGRRSESLREEDQSDVTVWTTECVCTNHTADHTGTNQSPASVWSRLM